MNGVLTCGDDSPRESEWDADVSHGSRESQLSSTTVGRIDWGGGPSYGVYGVGEGRGGSRDYSLLSPAMPRKGSVVTFDVGEPGARRHSSPAQPIRRKNVVVSTTTSMGDCQQPLSSALKCGKDSPSSPQQQQRQQQQQQRRTPRLLVGGGMGFLQTKRFQQRTSRTTVCQIRQASQRESPFVTNSRES